MELGSQTYRTALRVRRFSGAHGGPTGRHPVRLTELANGDDPQQMTDSVQLVLEFQAPHAGQLDIQNQPATVFGL